MTDQNETECRRTDLMLSDYVDNTLSARDMWEVEKHLAACPVCSQLAQHTAQTVQVLRSAETLDAGDDFMAKLHSRLDNLGPVPARRTPGTVLREWCYDLRRQFESRPMPALSVGLSSLVVAAVLFSSKPAAVTATKINAAEAVSQEALDRHVAVTASDPFDDPVAAKLEAESGNSDGGSQSGAN